MKKKGKFTINALKMVREIRDNMYEEYKKDPEAYLKKISKNKPLNSKKAKKNKN